MEWLNQFEIRNLEDKDLQLRYILGGLYPHGGQNCNVYWGCYSKCDTQPVEDDERLQKVKDFILNHNISNSTFLRLARSYIFETLNSYKGDFGSLIPELGEAILDYDFVHTKEERFKENDLKERELLELIDKECGVEGTALNTFLGKYSLTPVDFMILAKTSINYKFKIGRVFEVTDLPKDLQVILEANNLYQSYKFVEQYRKALEVDSKPFVKTNKIGR